MTLKFIEKLASDSNHTLLVLTMQHTSGKNLFFYIKASERKYLQLRHAFAQGKKLAPEEVGSIVHFSEQKLSAAEASLLNSL